MQRHVVSSGWIGRRGAGLTTGGETRRDAGGETRGCRRARAGDAGGETDTRWGLPFPALARRAGLTTGRPLPPRRRVDAAIARAAGCSGAGKRPSCAGRAGHSDCLGPGQEAGTMAGGWAEEEEEEEEALRFHRREAANLNSPRRDAL